jgi:hypothetical protein
VWRLHAVLWVSNEACYRGGAGEKLYVVMLSVVSFSAALLAVGLVRPWGEVFPSWLPLLGGRVVPLRTATMSAGLGAAGIFAVYLYAVLNPIFRWRTPPPPNPACPPPDLTPGAWIAYLAYAPLLLWGPLLLVVTISYYRRRSRPA